LLLATEPSIRIRTRLDSTDGRITLEGRPLAEAKPWTLHASARLRIEPGDRLFQNRTLAIPTREADGTAQEHYALAEAIGLAYGTAYQTIDRFWFEGNDSAIASLTMPASILEEVDAGHVHPAQLDAAFQLVIHLCKNDPDIPPGMAMLPITIEGAAWSAGCDKPAYARARIISRHTRSARAQLSLHDRRGRPVIVLTGVRFRRARLGKAASASLRFLDYVATPRPLAHCVAVPNAFSECA